ncbi:hypothetical protein ANRL1_02843 [Anaerolineae bacterium]|nr:hypothetical protein ANRL1_02843 [Anaerolineae bacterium]
MRLHFGGHLSWYDPQKRSHLEIQLARPMQLIELLQELGVPIAEIAVAAVNGQAIALEDARVSNDDRVELYPPVGGGE